MTTSTALTHDTRPIAATSAAAAAHHTRHNRTLLAATERALLIAIARRLPPWVTSDALSALGLLAMFGVAGAFALARWWPDMLLLVPGLLAVNWFGDSLDGTVARVRHHERPRYGYYVDHVIDLAGVSALMGGLALSGLMHPVIAVGLAAAYLLVSGEVYLATHVQHVFRMARWGFGPTELRLVLAAGALALWRNPWASVGGWQVRLFDVGGTVAAVGLVATFVFAAIQNGRHLYLAEPLPGGRDIGTR